VDLTEQAHAKSVHLTTAYPWYRERPLPCWYGWGCYPENGGKVVWALLRAEASHHCRERATCPGAAIVSPPAEVEGAGG